MYQGKTLQALAAEITRQSELKRDFIASTQTLTLETVGTTVALNVPGQGAFPALPHALSQIGAHLDIPKKYVDRMHAEEPQLLCDNVNTWFKREGNQTRRMVRTLDGSSRAFLSDRFRSMDNDIIAESALDTLHTIGTPMRIVSCELTPSRMYIKAAFPQMQREVKKGDVVESGIQISNSEVGSGATEAVPFTTRLICLNGMKHTVFGTRRNHVGRIVEGSDGSEIFASDTMRADARAFILKLRDVIKSVCNDVQFARIVASMTDASEQRLEGNPVQAVEVLARRLTFNDTEKGGVLRHLIEGGDLSRWGLANAVTRMAADAESYDRASELESLGGSVLELPKESWREIAMAA